MSFAPIGLAKGESPSVQENQTGPLTTKAFKVLWRSLRAKAAQQNTLGSYAKAKLYRDALKTISSRGFAEERLAPIGEAMLIFEIVFHSMRIENATERTLIAAAELADRHQTLLTEVLITTMHKDRVYRSLGRMGEMRSQLQVALGGEEPSAIEIQATLDYYYAAYLAAGQSHEAVKRFEKDVRLAYHSSRISTRGRNRRSWRIANSEVLTDIQIGLLLPILRRRFALNELEWTDAYNHWLVRALTRAVQSKQGAQARSFANERVALANATKSRGFRLSALWDRVSVAVEFGDCASALSDIDDFLTGELITENHAESVFWNVKGQVAKGECADDIGVRSQYFNTAFDQLDPLLDNPDWAGMAFDERRRIEELKNGRAQGLALWWDRALGLDGASDADAKRVALALGMSGEDLSLLRILGFRQWHTLRSGKTLRAVSGP